MIYLSLAVNLIVIAAAVLAVRAERQRAERYLERSVDRQVELLEQSRVREDQLLNRIQAPAQAPVQSMTQLAGPLEPAYISAFDDDALAEHEEKRAQVAADVARFIEENSNAVDGAE